MLASIRAGDTVAVESLSRLARGTPDLLKIAGAIHAKGAWLVSQKDAIDTSSADGRAFLTALAALAMLEKESAREKQRNGQDAARAAGRRLGRRQDEYDKTMFKSLYAQWKADQITATAMRKTLGMTSSTFYRRVREFEGRNGAETPPPVVPEPPARERAKPGRGAGGGRVRGFHCRDAALIGAAERAELLRDETVLYILNRIAAEHRDRFEWQHIRTAQDGGNTRADSKRESMLLVCQHAGDTIELELNLYRGGKKEAAYSALPCTTGHDNADEMNYFTIFSLANGSNKEAIAGEILGLIWRLSVKWG
jgi:hypothetical protein